MSTADESKLKNAKTLQIKSSHRYKHIGWTYIEIAPQQTNAKARALARGAGIDLVPDSVVTLTQIPSDPLVPNQTHLDPGFSSGDIHAFQAWDILTTATVAVAIIDSGIETTHEDLTANIWRNETEINGIADFDDDNNGYIDDFYGWNTFDNNNDVMDTLGHGTRVAGILGARGQNGIGIAGICWDVKMMPVRAFQNTTTTLSVIVDAFDYILSSNNNVRVINCSFGDDTFSQPMYDAIAEAGRKGILVVAAAGNSARNIDLLPFYPASYNLPNVIAVGAVTMDGNLWSGSNYGNTVGVVAPGTSMFSTTIANTYNSGNGTSYATPIVAGAAALIMTQWPYMPAEQVKTQINQTSRITNPLLSEQLGGGLLDMYAMLTRTISAAHDWQLYE
ncbi:S8 family serine peptidase [bacterium]|nr:S8 family serine peptidase [bacterium]